MLAFNDRYLGACGAYAKHKLHNRLCCATARVQVGLDSTPSIVKQDVLPVSRIGVKRRPVKYGRAEIVMPFVHFSSISQECESAFQVSRNSSSSLQYQESVSEPVDTFPKYDTRFAFVMFFISERQCSLLLAAEVTLYVYAIFI